MKFVTWAFLVALLNTLGIVAIVWIGVLIPLWAHILSLAAWVLCGVLGFRFWWDGDERFFRQHVLGASIFGPFAWVVGWLIHGSGQRWVKD